ncbi:DUF2971 domain-containing protein [Limnobacter profundi]|uniref:DUF2971 domain-containing protein n=1 Tax=Limnobacter profundi TaxID=2732163 RepID=A0ABX6N6I2_9BURK|nr:DUF2971 domain-containing protein [Limnobacter sp. SAORIC-580]QJR30030.1 DUF2971 domain-containing protein [Limnobacter sp. SAORIC-580]
MTYAQVMALAEHLAQSKQSDMLGTLQAVGTVAAAFITGKIDQVLGAFCLSEVPDSLLMWAHYASSHTGFVVEFDSMHPWFHEQKSEVDDLRRIRRVYYRDSRPSAPLSEMSVIELFLVKSSHWAYEREWRIVRPLMDAAETVAAAPYPVALFNVPPSAVTGVITGARMASEHEEGLRQAIFANPGLRDVRIRRAVADASHFLLRFEDDT